MWMANYDLRLRSWVDLRNKSQYDSLDIALSRINDWWLDTNWCPFLLHWDEAQNWPDPWELLQYNKHCELARGLGILYTIAIIDRKEFNDAVLVGVEESNLVLVNKGKYVLNLDDSTRVNIHSTKIKKFKHQFTIEEAHKKIN